MSSDQRLILPDTIGPLLSGYTTTAILTASVELDVFTTISRGSQTVTSIANACRSTERGMKALLDALVGIRLLVKRDGVYSLTPESKTFLVQDSPLFMGPMIEVSKDLAGSFDHLATSVRNGLPVRTIEQESMGAEFFSRLIAGLFPRNYPIARAVADQRLLGNVRDILDVAIGSGAWSIPLAASDPNIRVTGLDFQDVLPITRGFFRSHGVENQLLEMGGNLREVDFGKDCYDLVILGHILHSEGETSSRTVLRKAYRALRSGGCALIADYIPNADRTGPPQPLIFTLTMLLNTTEGTTFTISELRAMLSDAGFRTIRTLDTPAPSPLLVAEK